MVKHRLLLTLFLLPNRHLNDTLTPYSIETVINNKGKIGEINMYEILNVSRLFGQEYALKNISLEIKGGLNFIVGASGSGKTTLLKILAGLDQDFKGRLITKSKI